MKKTDYIIIGAGLAGLSIAYQLTKHGMSCIVIEKGSLGNGASGVPLGLANPATALNANLSWRAKECLADLNSTIEDIQPFTDAKIIVNEGIYRVAYNQKLYDKFHSAYISNEWPNDEWATWISPEEVSRIYPKLSDSFGALHVKPALSIAVPNYLKALSYAILRTNGEIIEQACIEEITGNRITISANAIKSLKEEILADKGIIWCAGFDLHKVDELSQMRLHGVLGQLDTYDFEDEILSKPISSLGYMEQTKDHKIHIGSTYNHHFSEISPTKKASDELLDKFHSLFPSTVLNEENRSSWVGVRTSTKDRMPITGPIPDKEGHFVHGGFGSKGLLYSAHLSRLLLDLLLSRKTLPLEIDVRRFYN